MKSLKNNRSYSFRDKTEMRKVVEGKWKERKERICFDGFPPCELFLLASCHLRLSFMIIGNVANSVSRLGLRDFILVPLGYINACYALDGERYEGHPHSQFCLTYSTTATCGSELLRTTPSWTGIQTFILAGCTFANYINPFSVANSTCNYTTP